MDWRTVDKRITPNSRVIDVVQGVLALGVGVLFLDPRSWSPAPGPRFCAFCCWRSRLRSWSSRPTPACTDCGFCVVAGAGCLGVFQGEGLYRERRGRGVDFEDILFKRARLRAGGKGFYKQLAMHALIRSKQLYQHQSLSNNVVFLYRTEWLHFPKFCQPILLPFPLSEPDFTHLIKTFPISKSTTTPKCLPHRDQAVQKWMKKLAFPTMQCRFPTNNRSSKTSI